jgi:hypothetical protein
MAASESIWQQAYQEQVQKPAKASIAAAAARRDLRRHLIALMPRSNGIYNRGLSYRNRT